MTTRFIGTSNHGFGQYAQEEIRRLFSTVRLKVLVPTEIVLFEVAESRDEAIAVIREREPIFLRHLQPVDHELEATQSAADLDALKRLISAQYSFNRGEKVAVQVRKEERANAPYSPFEVKSGLDEVLADTHHAEPVVRAADRIISIYVTGSVLYIGLSRPEENLSDWSGGAIRFQKEEDQISRAKFKLHEAEQKFRLDFTSYRSGLDIGAAPGGWTSLLLERGLKVTAIDPAKLHPSLIGNRNLIYFAKNAGDVKLRPNEFDLLVCDMSWNPKQMGRLVGDLLYSLRIGGTAIITVKLMHKKPFQTVRELMQLFSQTLELVQAKQLFHNREELTLYLRKN